MKVRLHAYLEKLFKANSSPVLYKYSHWSKDRKSSRFGLIDGSICFSHQNTRFNGSTVFGGWCEFRERSRQIKSVRVVRSGTEPTYVLLEIG